MTDVFPIERKREGSGTHGSVSRCARETETAGGRSGEGARRSRARVGIEAQPERCCRLLATSRRLPTRVSVERGLTESSYGQCDFLSCSRTVLGEQFRSERSRYILLFVLYRNAREAKRERKRGKEKERKGCSLLGKEKETYSDSYLFIPVFVKISRPC